VATTDPADVVPAIVVSAAASLPVTVTGIVFVFATVPSETVIVAVPLDTGLTVNVELAFGAPETIVAAETAATPAAELEAVNAPLKFDSLAVIVNVVAGWKRLIVWADVGFTVNAPA
jgi:hypothetical protein